MKRLPIFLVVAKEPPAGAFDPRPMAGEFFKNIVCLNKSAGIVQDNDLNASRLGSRTGSRDPFAKTLSRCK
jgi:hypothetical protein